VGFNNNRGDKRKRKWSKGVNGKNHDGGRDTLSQKHWLGSKNHGQSLLRCSKGLGFSGKVNEKEVGRKNKPFEHKDKHSRD